MKPAVPKLQRCAIYTRKSTEHNLDLEFNSLDAQREACEAYIKSQAHEGWRLVPDHYDDGGLSGASLDRPALDEVVIFKALVLQALYNLSDDQAEYQLRDRLSFMRFLGLGIEDAVPDARPGQCAARARRLGEHARAQRAGPRGL
jgi:hypothetical protein